MNIFTGIRYSFFSTLDGYSSPEEYAEYSKSVNQKFLCITDHGQMGSVPRAIRACEENNLECIFGCELYLNPNQPEVENGKKTSDYLGNYNEDDKKKMRKSYHLLAIATTLQGYSNLVRMTSWGWTKGFYYKPRINYQMLNAHKEGLIFTSCCYMGEIGQAFDTGGEEAGEAKLVEYIKMFGADHFYLEIMLLDFSKQKPYDVFIIKMSQKYNLKLVVTQDCHFCKKEDSIMQRKMLCVETGKTWREVEEAIKSGTDMFEIQDENLWMKSEEELNSFWLEKYSDVIEYDVLASAKRNTVEICNRAKGVKLDRSMKLPQISDANAKLMEGIMEGVKYRGIPKNKVYLDRIKEEYELITQKEFSSYFLITKMMTDEARRFWGAKTGGDGTDAVGPGRGSCVGSLVCYLLGITDVDPIRHDLLFSRFLSPARGGKSMKLKFSQVL